MKTSEATGHIIPAWTAALAEFTVVNQDREGHHGGYASLSAVFGLVKPILRQHGLTLQQYAKTLDRGVTVVTRIWHGETGQWLEDEGLTLPCGNDPQKAGGAITYAKRYALTMFLCVTTADDDAQECTTEIRNPAPPPAPPAPRPNNPEVIDVQPVEPLSPARQVFDALVRYKGTPVAAQMKEWAASEGKKLTLVAMEPDEAWTTAVAERLADTIESSGS